MTAASRRRVGAKATEPRRLRRAAGIALSPSRLFLDIDRCPANSILVVGSPRSGTTWVTEVLASATGSRVIFEPLHPLRSEVTPSGHSWTRYLDPSREDAELEVLLEQILSGRLRSRWSDRHNTRRIARRRVIKCVAATNLLPWIRRHFPELRILYVVRHPFAVSESLQDLVASGRPEADFSRYVNSLDDAMVDRTLFDGPLRDQGDVLRDAHARASTVFRRSLVLWCLANVLPLTSVDGASWSTALHFEHLVADRQIELARVANSLGIRIRLSAVSLKVASASDYRRRIESARGGAELDANRVGGWRDSVSDRDIGFGLTLLRDLGLDRIYTDDPLPQSTPEELPCSSQR